MMAHGKAKPAAKKTTKKTDKMSHTGAMAH